MGCCSSQAWSVREKLDKVQSNLDSLAVKESGDEHLDLLEVCVKDLREAFQECALISSRESFISRIQKQSDVILSNLESRIGSNLLERPDVDVIIQAILHIGKELDAVRATKATTLLTTDISAAREQFVQPQMVQLKNEINGFEFDQPEQLEIVGPRVLDLTEHIYKYASGSDSVTTSLLQYITAFLVRFFKAIEKGFKQDAELVHVASQLAERLDVVGTELGNLKSKTWEKTVDKVEGHIQNQARKVVETHLGACEAQLGKASTSSLDDLQNLKLSDATFKAWWIHAKAAEGLHKRLLGVFTTARDHAVESFKQITGTGDFFAGAAFLEFARDFDQNQEALVGESFRLYDELVEVSSTHDAGAHLGNLEREVEEEDVLNLSAVVSLVETLVPMWANAALRDGFPARLGTTFALILSKFTTEVSKTGEDGNIERLVEFQTFAARFDKLRSSLVPPAPKPGDELNPIVALTLGELRLCAAEAEVAKTEGLNPSIILQGLGSFAQSTKDIPLSDDVAARVRVVTNAVEARVLKTFIAAPNDEDGLKKRQNLLIFATKFDKMGNSLRGIPLRLQKRLSGCEAIIKNLVIAEEEMAKSSHFNAMVLLKALHALQPLLSEYSDISQVLDRLSDIFTTVDGRMTEGCGKIETFEKADIDKLKRQLQVAQDLETMGISSGVAPADGLTLRCISAAVAKCLTAVTSCVADPFSSTISFKSVTAACTCIISLREQFAKFPELVEQFQSQVDAMAASLEGPLGHAAAAINVASTELVECANVVKDVCDIFKSTSAGDLRKLVRSLIEISDKLTMVEKELNKDKGMNPRVLVDTLKELSPKWEEVASASSLLDRRTAAYEKVASRMMISMQEGIEAKNMKKVETLLEVALNIDASAEAFGSFNVHSQLKDKLSSSSMGRAK